MNKKIMKFGKVLAPLLALSFLSSCVHRPETKNVYIAWSDRQNSYSFISTLKTVTSIGCNPVVLDMVRSNDLSYGEDGTLIDAVDEHRILLPEPARKVKASAWRHSNVKDIMKDVKYVIFPGGSDICPTLRRTEGEWHGIEGDTDYAPERDVSDYLLMSYCLDHSIPVFAICRGMQMLSVVSGATMIDDIPTYFASLGKGDKETHRDAEKTVFAAHDVDVTDDSSLLYKITKQTKLEKVPSWHHQGVLSVEGTPLSVTAKTTTDGVSIIEAVERKDLPFCLGVQFHPEVAVRKAVDKEADAGNYMDQQTAASFFRALVEPK